jgi:hypothetical protein
MSSSEGKSAFGPVGVDVPCGLVRVAPTVHVVYPDWKFRIRLFIYYTTATGIVLSGKSGEKEVL